MYTVQCTIVAHVNMCFHEEEGGGGKYRRYVLSSISYIYMVKSFLSSKCQFYVRLMIVKFSVLDPR